MGGRSTLKLREMWSRRTCIDWIVLLIYTDALRLAVYDRCCLDTVLRDWRPERPSDDEARG